MSDPVFILPDGGEVLEVGGADTRGPILLYCGGCDDTWDPAVYAVALGERCPMCGWKFQRFGEVE